ncbi:hypothetical protein PCZ31_2961 [Clostridioides difficile]|nr:hypothetical protein PCZ31_2961 [Clostridioides difficile]
MQKISAFGSLRHLNNQNASGEMAQNCLQCLVEKNVHIQQREFI